MKEIEEIEKKINEYNNLPDHLKIDNKYPDIKKEINNYYGYLDQCKQLLDDAIINENTYSNEININGLNLDLCILRLEEIIVIFKDNELEINDMINLFRESQDIIFKCKCYLNNLKITIIDL